MITSPAALLPILMALGSNATPIMIQRVEANGHTKIGDPVELPPMTNEYYDVSYATATSVLGPYTKVQHPDAPLIVTDDSKGLWGPDGADMVVSKDGNGFLMVYHNWNHPYQHDNPEDKNWRGMNAARVGFSDGVMSLI